MSNLQFLPADGTMCMLIQLISITSCFVRGLIRRYKLDACKVNKNEIEIERREISLHAAPVPSFIEPTLTARIIARGSDGERRFLHLTRQVKCAPTIPTCRFTRNIFEQEVQRRGKCKCNTGKANTLRGSS